MNYREQQLRSLIKKDYVSKNQYQQEIIELQQISTNWKQNYHQLNEKSQKWQQEKQELTTNWNQEKANYQTELTNLTQANNHSQQLVQELTKNCQQLTAENNNQQAKITRLETILNKDKKDKSTQTMLDYEEIIKGKEQQIKELQERYGEQKTGNKWWWQK